MASNEVAIPGCVTVLAEAFGKTVSPGMFRAYELGLSGLTPDQVTTATQLALERCRFMPAPAELRDMVFVRIEDRAVKAWVAFEKAVVSHGYIRSVNFDDPVINATVKALGGWDQCCGMPAAEFDTFLQKRFQDTYCALARTGVSGEQAAPLVGWIDRENGLLGYAQEQPHVVKTGLPALPNRQPKRIKAPESRADVPRLELKKP